MIRPEVVKQLECPLIGLATSWSIGRRSIPYPSLPALRTDFKRECWPYPKEKIRKSADKANRLREQGNEAYKKAPNEPEKALQLYNQSICMAEEGSKELGLGYANRSAVFFNQKLYRECLADINLARQHHYPEEMMHKLTNREDRCKKLLEDMDNPAKKGGMRHCSIQSCLELSADAKGIRTRRSLSVGEMVLLEKPFIIVLEPELAYRRCDYCGASDARNLFPCNGCTSVMYCSHECRDQSLQRYHQFECEILDDLQSLYRGSKPVRMLHVVLRMFWLCVLLYLEDPVGFPKRVTNPTELAKCRDPFKLEPSDYVLHIIATCPDDAVAVGPKEATDKCVRQFLSVLTYVIAVEENANLWSRLKDMPDSDILLSLLYRMTFNTSSLVDDVHLDLSCYYPFTRLLRVSCAPNAELMVHGVQNVVVLKRPVAEGQEITIATDENLTTDHASKSKRADKRKSDDECECEGCENDYPELASLPVDEELALELENIRTETDENIKRQALVDFMQHHNVVYPKRELADAWKMYRPFVAKNLSL